MNRDEAKRRLMGMAKEALVECFLSRSTFDRYEFIVETVEIRDLNIKRDRAWAEAERLLNLSASSGLQKDFNASRAAWQKGEGYNRRLDAIYKEAIVK